MKKYLCILIALFLFLCSCQNEQFENELIQPENPRQGQPAEEGVSEKYMNYFSITFGEYDETAPNAYNICYYTYSVENKELTLQATIPFDADYAVGATNIYDGKIYFSNRQNAFDEYSNDCIYAYDIETGMNELIYEGPLSFNDINVIDKNRLLITAIKNDRTIQPAAIDLTTNEVTYLLESFLELYTIPGAIRTNYNYGSESFVSFMFTWEDATEEFNTGKKPISYTAAVMTLNAENPIKHSIKTEPFYNHFVPTGAFQLSENKMVFTILELPTVTDYDTYHSYLVDFSGETQAITEIRSLFPEHINASSVMTFDEGKTFYCKGVYEIDGVKYSGFFHWCSQDEIITPILLDSDEGHVVNFSFTK